MKGRKTFTQPEADDIIKLIRLKLLADTYEQKKIRDKIRVSGFYASDFGIGGGYNENDFLCVIDISANSQAPQPVSAASGKSVRAKTAGRKDSDESYVIDLCDELLGVLSLRQHRFSFLSGDSGMPLPVDAYYPSIGLVIEYHEKQHTDKVRFWDSKHTISGMSRAEQRRHYDERRRKTLPENKIQLVVIDYTQLSFKASSKKLSRDSDFDRKAIKDVLKEAVMS